MRQAARSCLWRYYARAPRSLVEVLDEAAEAVARDELLALERSARRGRGVLWFSSHCSMALRSYVWPSTF